MVRAQDKLRSVGGSSAAEWRDGIANEAEYGERKR